MTNEQAIDIIRNEYKCVDRECDIERSCGKCPYMIPTKEPILKAYEMAIQALSQEPTDTWSIKDVADTFKKHGLLREQEPCDAVSREAVLKIIDGWYEQNRDTENIEDLIILITYMNSVQPKTVSSDVVSKTEVKRIVDFYKEQYDGIYHINESIEKLPSVNPQPICEEREKGECPYYAG